MTIKSLISKFDFLSAKPELYFGKRDRLETMVGGVFSLLVYAFTFAALAYFSLDFLHKTNPIVNQSVYFSNTTKILLNKDNFFVKFGLFFNNGSVIPNYESFYRVVARQYNYYYEYDNITLANELRLNTINIPLVKCTEDYINTFFKTFSYSPYDHMYCLDPGYNITMLNPYGNVGENSYMNIFFAFCDNSTASVNNTTCASIDVIKETLRNYMVKFSFSDYYVDHNNYTHPMRGFINELSTRST